MKKVIITGASGFVGTNFINRTNSYECVAVDLLTQHVDEVDFKNVDSVLHLAALVHQMKGASEAQYFKINRDLAFDVAKKAKENGVKQFIFMSTAKVYGESTNNDFYYNENSVCFPVDPYGKSKYEAEMLIRSLEDDTFKVAIVRSPLVYGIGVKANMFSLIHLVDRFSILPLGDINNERSIVYIGNLVALLTKIIKEQVSGVFIAGDKTPLSTTQIVQFIALGFNKKLFVLKLPNIIIKGMKSVFPSIIDRLYGSLVLDNSNTNRILNFNPPYSSEEGIHDMVEWYKIIKLK